MSDSTKKGGFKLKNGKYLFKDKDKKKKKAKKLENVEEDLDMKKHGGYWRMTEELDLVGGVDISFECGSGNGTYLAALDNGRFTIGGPHAEGDAPSPEEIFALVKTPDDSKISLKTGYNKYVGIDTNGQLIATAEAIGARERFIPVFQDDKSALQSVSTHLFLSMNTGSDNYVYVAAKTATEEEMINFRTNAVRNKGPVDWRSADDRKNAKDCETSYIKSFQHSKVDLKGRHISIDVNDRKGVKRAQSDGSSHEFMLDRRAKMKSDRYC